MAKVKNPTYDLAITAKDVAHAIAFRRDPKGFAKAFRQVQHWTTQGLLQTVSPRETGKGVARLYADQPTVQIAAMLQELVLFGLTVDDLEPITDRLYEDHDDGDPDDIFDAMMTGEFKGYLCLEFEVDAKGQQRLVGSRTFTTRWQEDELKENMPRTGSAIMLDLGKISERIDWPYLNSLFDESRKGST